MDTVTADRADTVDTAMEDMAVTADMVDTAMAATTITII